MKELIAPLGYWPGIIFILLFSIYIVIAYGAPIGGRKPQWLYSFVFSAVFTAGLAIGGFVSFYGGTAILIVGGILLLPLGNRLKN